MRVIKNKKTGKIYVEIPTRAESKMQTYAKTLASANGGVFWEGRTLKAMLREAAERFLKEKPWEHGLQWRPAKGLTATSKDRSGQKEATGWMQVNIRLPEELGDALDKLANEQHVSLSSVGYTMLYWWTWCVYPPVSEREARGELSPCYSESFSAKNERTVYLR